MPTTALWIAGWLLMALGISLYLGAIAAAVIRVRRQYSQAMIGMGIGRLITGAALAAAGRWWPALIPVALGIGAVVVTR